MTLTIDLPPQLEKAALKLATARGKTIEEVARQALAEWMAEKLEDEEDARLALERWEALERGDTTERDWDEFVAELDAEEAAGALPRESCPRG